jgi:glycosyltransferase involved in cell wall biosynthesis
MKLSVVIPAYNEEKYIGPCLKAAIKEAASARCEVEIVVVNNASTDRTAAVAGCFPGVKVVTEPHKGLSMARHRGYKESRGELIANVDADCLMPRGYIEKVLRQFERTPRLALLSGPFFYYDLPQVAQIFSRIFYMLEVIPNFLGQYVFKLGAVAQGGNFVVRRKFLDKVGGFNTAIDFYGEDTDIAIRLSHVGLVRFSQRLPMKTSGRRLAREGILRAGYFYFLNIVFMMFRGRPLSRTHNDIRDR